MMTESASAPISSDPLSCHFNFATKFVLGDDYRASVYGEGGIYMILWARIQGSVEYADGTKWLLVFTGGGRLV